MIKMQGILTDGIGSEKGDSGNAKRREIEKTGA
jgi:hypothetical protein